MGTSDAKAYRVADGYLYSKDHEWIKIKEGRVALVGITDYAAQMLHDIVYVNLPIEGTTLKKKEVLGQVESVKTVSDIYMPVSGKVLKTNLDLTKTPEKVSESPYEEGWMLEIETADFDKESSDLLSSAAYREYVSNLKE